MWLVSEAYKDCCGQIARMQIKGTTTQPLYGKCVDARNALAELLAECSALEQAQDSMKRSMEEADYMKYSF